MFSNVGPEELNIILNAMEERKASENEVIIREGDEGNCLYVVESGNLICTKRFVRYSTIRKMKPNPDC